MLTELCCCAQPLTESLYAGIELQLGDNSGWFHLGLSLALLLVLGLWVRLFVRPHLTPYVRTYIPYGRGICGVPYGVPKEFRKGVDSDEAEEEQKEEEEAEQKEVGGHAEDARWPSQSCVSVCRSRTSSSG